MSPALSSLRKIARALWDIRNPPAWVQEHRERAYRKQYVQSLSDKQEARKVRMRIAMDARRRGLSFREVGRIMGVSAQGARSWYYLAILYNDRNQLYTSRKNKN